ncbi:MAG: LTA synthase family protein [Solobacterium sp.]|nr:LTA synthase family protein [Solobacterium sp.]
MKNIFNGIDETEHSLRRRLAEVLFAVLAVIYEEVLLNLTTVRTINSLYIPQVILFSAAYGILIFWVGTLTRSGRTNRMIRGILYVILCDLYGVYYFVYRSFKVFYDVNTVVSGGAGVAEGFTGQVIDMTTSRSGMMHIILFLMPFFLYILFMRRFDSGEKRTPKEQLVFYAATLLFAVCGIAYVQSDTMLSRVYADEYSFQAAVADFGLMTGLRLDVEHHLRNRNSDTVFHDETMLADTAETELSEAVTTAEKPVTYGFNKLNIDFNTLIAGGDSVTGQLDQYVQAQKPSRQNAYTGMFEGKNLIFISAEAFSAEVIDPERTPTLYRLATKGINFTDYYQPASAGTTGGEYENVFGLMPTEGGSSFKITSKFHNVMTMAYQLNERGYNGWAFHNNDYTFYDRNITHNNLGYSNGFTGYGNGLEENITSQWPESDLEMMEATVDQYIDAQPFNVYYMSVSGHNPYNGGNAMAAKHWDEVKDLEGYTDSVKGYLAANMELEDAMTYLVGRLEEKGIADDTVIVLGADHFPYGLDYGEALNESDNLANLYGYQPANYLERDHNRLILWSGCLEEAEPIIVDTPTSSIDILPTLLNLFGAEWDSRLLPGRDVFSDRMPLVFNLSYDWKTDKGTYIAGTGVFTPNEGVEVSDTYVDSIRQIVQNRLSYCRGVLRTDYFWHVLGNKE